MKEREYSGGSLLTWIHHGIGIAIGFAIVSVSCSVCSVGLLFVLAAAGVAVPNIAP